MDQLCVLAVSSCEQDLTSLQLIVHSEGWKLHCAHTFAEAVAFVHEHPAVVVISEPVFPDGDWKQLLSRLIAKGHPSALVVFSHLADEGLWGEVLRLGGYDVLLKPFDKDEVIRVIELAWQQCKETCMKQRRTSPPPLSNSD